MSTILHLRWASRTCVEHFRITAYVRSRVRPHVFLALLFSLLVYMSNQLETANLRGQLNDTNLPPSVSTSREMKTASFRTNIPWASFDLPEGTTPSSPPKDASTPKAAM